MNESSNSKVAPERARDAYRKSAAQFEDLVPTQLPEAMRALAEKNIAQTRELYERPCLHAGLYLSTIVPMSARVERQVP